jgi:ketosteroid isomerase-like protein
VRSYGDAAVALGTQRVENGHAVRFLRVWVKQDGEWKLVAGQGTPVADDAGYTSVISSIVATPQASPTGRPDRTVLAVENALLTHDAHNEDTDVLALASNDPVFVSHAGAPTAYQARKPIPFKSEIVSWDRVQSYGDIAVVQGTLLWTDVNGYTPGQLRFTRVWFKQAGDWKLAAEQRTPISFPR